LCDQICVKVNLDSLWKKKKDFLLMKQQEKENVYTHVERVKLKISKRLPCAWRKKRKKPLEEEKKPLSTCVYV